MRRWVGIDEAGYGPNLGPLVMTAVVAEDLRTDLSNADCPDLWSDLFPNVSRAGGGEHLLWIDDSKKVYRGGEGRPRLDAACALVSETTGAPPSESLSALCQALDAGSLKTCELDRWLTPEIRDWPWPHHNSLNLTAILRPSRPLCPSNATWRLTEVRTIVVGPERFNAWIGRGGSKAYAHFEAFSELLKPIWDRTGEGDSSSLSCDKHGGRHFYLEPLRRVFQDEWIERGPEGPELSRYLVRSGGRSLELKFAPRADAENGLVALASLVSKAVRESWMDAFNAFWAAKIPGLRPTAGYPVDARRFRREIEGIANELGLEPRLWWREK